MYRYVILKFLKETTKYQKIILKIKNHRASHSQAEIYIYNVSVMKNSSYKQVKISTDKKTINIPIRYM